MTTANSFAGFSIDPEDGDFEAEPRGVEDFLQTIQSDANASGSANFLEALGAALQGPQAVQNLSAQVQQRRSGIAARRTQFARDELNRQFQLKQQQQAQAAREHIAGLKATADKREFDLNLQFKSVEKSDDAFKGMVQDGVLDENNLIPTTVDKVKKLFGLSSDEEAFALVRSSRLEAEADLKLKGAQTRRADAGAVAAAEGTRLAEERLSLSNKNFELRKEQVAKLDDLTERAFSNADMRAAQTDLRKARLDRATVKAQLDEIFDKIRDKKLNTITSLNAKWKDIAELNAAVKAGDPSALKAIKIEESTTIGGKKELFTYEQVITQLEALDASIETSRDVLEAADVRAPAINPFSLPGADVNFDGFLQHGTDPSSGGG